MDIMMSYVDEMNKVAPREILKEVLEKVADNGMLSLESKKWRDVLNEESNSLLKGVFMDDHVISIEKFIERFFDISNETKNEIDNEIDNENLIYVDGKPVNMDMIDMDGNIKDKNGNIVGKVNLKDLTKYHSNLPEPDEEEENQPRIPTKKSTTRKPNPTENEPINKPILSENPPSDPKPMIKIVDEPFTLDWKIGLSIGLLITLPTITYIIYKRYTRRN